MVGATYPEMTQQRYLQRKQNEFYRVDFLRSWKKDRRCAMPITFYILYITMCWSGCDCRNGGEKPSRSLEHFLAPLSQMPIRTRSCKLLYFPRSSINHTIMTTGGHARTCFKFWFEGQYPAWNKLDISSAKTTARVIADHTFVRTACRRLKYDVRTL